MSGFAEASTEDLLVIQENLFAGLALVAKHLEAGTFKVAAKDGAAPPDQAGTLTLSLLLELEDELEGRIRGFKRSIDPSLIKTL